jgi:DNA-binding ferritin-like protein (Dps family)
MTQKKQPPIRDYEDFRKRVLALPKEKQAKVLAKAFDLVYDQLDDNVWRTIATAIKHAKDSGLEGHEDFQIEDKDLKKLTHIQDGYRKKDH